MPSPFPGMDPFLEDPEVFPNLHHDLITFLQGALQPLLPPPYFAGVGTRVWVEEANRFTEPDVDVFRPDRPPAREPTESAALLAGTEASPLLIQVPEEEHYEAFVNIYKGRDQVRLVTSIEVLSPTNKTPGAHGRDLYTRKQQEMLEGQVNLVELDLLRAGRHTTSVPEGHARARGGPFDYHVCVRLGDRPRDFHLYPIRLEQRLPKVAIPLSPGDPFVTIDLQTVFDRSYDIGPYPRCVRYGDAVPPPPLRPEQAEWVTRTLHDKGLLPPDPGAANGPTAP